ncbi:MAG: aldehyde dehydrogenase family protein [candidate division NC10 bacterium]|nr:aldehyde dehydrogenase family protein [candidate division NC10 bacterium]
MNFLPLSLAKCPRFFNGDGGGTGYFVGPTIFADVSPDAVIAEEEIFGPVLAVIQARDFEEALSLANRTAYALTGGLYSRSPASSPRTPSAAASPRYSEKNVKVS